MGVFKKSVLPLLLICLLGAAVYSNTLDSSFHFDDNSNIVQNTLIKDFKYILHPSRAIDASMEYNLLSTNMFGNRIVGYASLALNYRLGGLDERGYHIFNIAVHLITAMLVFWFALITFKTPRLTGSRLAERARAVALFTALLFVAHPVQTQAVTYIVQRFASLAALFYLASLLSYAGARLARKTSARYGLYALTMIFAVLAMKTKEIAFTLPPAIALYELLFFEDTLKRRLKYLAPLFLTMLIIPATIYFADASVSGGLLDATKVKTDMPRLTYLFTEFRVIVTYLRLLALPVNQSLDYLYPKFTSFSDPQVFLSFAFLVSVAALGIFTLRRSRSSAPELRLISFGIFWFFLTLSIESSFIPIEDVIFEHRLYLPSVGVLFAVVSAAFMLGRTHEKLSRAVPVFLVALCLLMSVKAYARNAVWKSEVTLWQDVVEKSPENGRAHTNLGYAYDTRGETEKAIEQYLIAIRIAPDEKSYINLAAANKDMGRIDKAIEYLEEAKRHFPYSANVYNNLGVIYYNLDEPEKAIEQYKMAVSINPRDARIHLNLGIAYSAVGLKAKAEHELALASSMNPALFVGGH